MLPLWLRERRNSRTLNKCAKTKGHEEDLQATVGCDPGDRFFHDFKLAGFYRNVVEINCCKNDPGYFQQPEGDPISEAHCGQCRWHFEKKNGDCDRCQCTRDRAPVRFHLESGQQSEKHHNRKSRNQCREPPMAKWVVNLSPLHCFLTFGKHVV